MRRRNAPLRTPIPTLVDRARSVPAEMRGPRRCSNSRRRDLTLSRCARETRVRDAHLTPSGWVWLCLRAVRFKRRENTLLLKPDCCLPSPVLRVLLLFGAERKQSSPFRFPRADIYPARYARMHSRTAALVRAPPCMFEFPSTRR